MKLLILIFSIIAISGCAASKEKGAVGEDAARTFTIQPSSIKTLSGVALDAENQRIIEEKTAEVLNFCLPRLSGFESETMSQAKQAYWLSMSGLIAGSVVAPALTAAAAEANAAWTAGLSGWAGATNFAGQALRTSGLSGSSIAETRNNIINRVMAQVEVAGDGTKTFNERRDALMKARAACILYEIAVPSIPQLN